MAVSRGATPEDVGDLGEEGRVERGQSVPQGLPDPAGVARGEGPRTDGIGSSGRAGRRTLDRRRRHGERFHPLVAGLHRR
ncbi:hypothetical protein BHE74_00025434 [Ensete ventricosum]|nr:hypothetical protein BHE74_00025434 [Ensete ventricosum]